MTLYAALGVLAGILIGWLWWRLGDHRSAADVDALRVRPLLSVDAQQLYARLQVALPAHRVMPAVSLGSFVYSTAADKAVRARRAGEIRSQTIDFLICDVQLYPLAAVELEDVVRGGQDRGAVRRMLREAGLPLLRWTTVELPNVGAIRDAVAELEAIASVELEPALLGADSRREPYL